MDPNFAFCLARVWFSCFLISHKSMEYKKRTWFELHE